MTEDEMLVKVIRRAQEHGKSAGYKIGQSVTHPGIKFICDLVSISGDKARLVLKPEQNKQGVEIDQEFPLSEIFDPNVAIKLATQVYQEELNRNMPPGTGVLVVDV